MKLYENGGQSDSKNGSKVFCRFNKKKLKKEKESLVKKIP